MTKLLLVVVLVSSSASAQIAISPKTDLTATLAPTATATVSPISNGVMFNGTLVSVYAGLVNVYSAQGPVMLLAHGPAGNGSSVALVTNNGPIPNGTYSVQFVFTYSVVSSAIRITAGSTVLKQCPLADQQNWFTPERVCDSGPFEITNNRLAIEVDIPSGNSALLTRIVMNAYPTLRAR